ncbi:MAG: hypothetical protein HY223_00670 [Thaumarchaeota archaeon]|nr:hypothetical protein [Nitrososphaerota archaeon]
MKSVIYSIYSLENVAEAHKKMLKGNIFGKILIKLN